MAQLGFSLVLGDWEWLIQLIVLDGYDRKCHRKANKYILLLSPQGS